MGDGAHVIQLNRRMPMHEVSAIARRIAQDPDVLDVLPDRLFFPQLTPTDPQYTNQWNLTQANGINMPAAWDITTGSSNMVIAILDTGYLNHADLSGRWIGGYDFVSNTDRSNDSNLRDADATDPGDWVTAMEAASAPLIGCPVTDSRWHGTAMAGIIAANANNATGIAGINWNAKLLPVRVVGKCGGYESDIIDAMRWSVGIPVPGVPDNPNKAKLLNVSLAAVGSCSPAYQSAIDDVTGKGVTIIVSAGNNGALVSNYSPGNCNGVITIGAVDKNGGLPGYANTGAAVAVAAPGGSGTGNTAIPTTLDSGTTTAVNDSIYAELTGTSIAAAHATGVASLMLTLNPVLLPSQIKYFLKNTAGAFPDAVALGSATNCNVNLCGGGIVDARSVLAGTRWFVGNIPQLSLAVSVSMGLRSDGRVFEWGAYPVMRADVSNVARLARSDLHTLAVRTDGTMMAWGSNGYGQLGDGTTTGTTLSVPVAGFNGAAAAAAGIFNSLALKIDGTVWAWGWNALGQLGDGTTTNRGTPAPVSNLGGITAIASGDSHLLALKSDGSVWAWGYNVFGQLGDGSTTNRMIPVAVTGLTNVIAIAAANHYSLALKSDGTVWAWGDNITGQLGDGTATQRLTPVQASGLTNVTAISAGSDDSPSILNPGHALALRSDGTVWSWGFNDRGQLGDGTTTNRLTPVQVIGLANVASVGAGVLNSMAIKTDGSVYAWGIGALGTGVSPTPLPLAVLGVGGVGTLNLDINATAFTPRVDIALASTVQSNALIITGIANGSAVSVTGGTYKIDAGTFTSVAGTINSGQSVSLQQTASANCGTTTLVTVTIAGLAGGPRSFSVTTVPCDITPNALSALVTQAAVALNSVRTSTTITITGINGPTPISVSGGEYSIGCTATFTAAAGNVANNQTVCVRQTASSIADTLTTAILTVGPLSTSFRVITATGPAFNTPPQIQLISGLGTGLRTDGRLLEWDSNGTLVTRSDISGATRIAKSPLHSIALRSDGGVWSWGNNGFGQLGDATTINSTTAIPVTGLSTVTSMATGTDHSVAVKADGTVWAWGGNYNSQLGNGTTTASAIPIQVPGLVGVTAIAAGDVHTLALKTDGTVWGWGANGFGELGDGTVVGIRSTPVQVTGLSNVTAIAAASHYSLALKSDGTLWAWGNNGYGQFANGTMTNSSVPLQVTALNGVGSIAAGATHVVALKTDGTVWTWGRNANGQLGDGTFNSSLVPVQVTGLANVATVAAGVISSAAIMPDGSVYGWGGTGASSSVVPGLVLGGAGTINLDANATTFTSRVGLPLNNVVQSNTLVITGIANGSAISVTGGNYRIDAGAFTAAAGLINDGQSLTLRQTSAATCGTTTLVTVTIAGLAGGPRSFSVTTLSCDTTPNPLASLDAQVNVPLSSVRTSNTISVSGINGPTPISVAGGEYSIGCAASFTATAGNIANNQTVCVRQTASSSADTVTTAVLTVGPLSVAFRIITAVGPGFSAVPQVVTSATNTAALRSDGRVIELIGTPSLRADISGAVMIARGSVHSLALRADGTVWAWGQNAEGQLGDGTMTDSTAKPVPGLSGVISVAAGDRHSLALKADGTVWAWGSNFSGELGDGTTTRRLTPVQVTGLTDVVQIAGPKTYNFSLALKSDGTVWGWGYNGNGQLGDGTMTQRLTPVQTMGLANITALSAAIYHELALKSDGTVWAWGRNYYGELGDGTTMDRLLPVQVAGLTGVAGIAAGTDHSVALKTDGTVWIWGYDGTVTNRYSPVQVPGLSGIVSLTASTNFSIAIDTDGNVFGWAGGILPYLTIGVGGQGTLDLNPSVGGFTSRTGINLNAVLQSNPITPPGIANGSAITVTGGEYQIDAGAFTTSAGTINAGQAITLRQTAAATCGTTTLATVTISGLAAGPLSFSVTTTACDTTPNPLASLMTQAGVPVNSVRTSNTITINGINGPTPISVTGGLYSIGCTATFTSTAGTIANSQTVCVRQTAAASADTVTTAALTVGTATANFRVITAEAPTFTTTPQVVLNQGTASLRSDGRVFDWSPFYPALRTDISGVVQMARAGYHMLALRADGTVWGWGDNQYGQLADGTTTSTTTAIPAIGLTGVAAVAAGYLHSMVLKLDGTVWAWGYNYNGELGDGTTTNRLAPIQVPGLTSVIAISVNQEHSMALKSDGTVWSWGYPGGVLGNGTANSSTSPVQVSGLTSITAISVGTGHALALKSDGTVWAWGSNSDGRLGDGTLTARLTPVQVSGLTGVTAISATQEHSVALKADGTVWTWGRNFGGSLGDGTNVQRLTPVQAAGIGNVIAIASGSSTTVAIKSDGIVYVWGSGAISNGNYGSFLPVVMAGENAMGTHDLIVNGFAPSAFAFLPVYGAQPASLVESNTITVSGLSGPSPITVSNAEVSITAGAEISINGGTYSRDPNTVFNGDTVRVRMGAALGYESLTSTTVNIGGAVGTSSTFYVYTRRDPARPPATPAISLGDSHSILLNAKGNVFGFGYNGNGQLGNGTSFSTSVPTPVAGVAGIIQVASGANHVLALLTDGTIKAWGYNNGGQLGNDNGYNNASNAVTVTGLTFVKAIAAGRNHSLALKADGTVWAWGLNLEGQLGDGSLIATRPTPVQIAGLTNVIAIAAGDRHSMALLSNGQIRAWGANESGQLGDGTNNQRRVPTTITTLNGMTRIAAGGSHSLAIKFDGTAWGWGANGFGQLGIGTNANSSTPVQIMSLDNTVGLIAAGENHSLAVKSGGALFSWGSNLNSQLGDGASTNRNTPFAVATPTSVTAISAGARHSAAINNTGRLYVWGDNAFGQVGNKSGNYNPQAGGTNVLQGASQISTYAQAAGSSTGTSSTSGSAVIEINEIATGYDFKTLTIGNAGNALGKFKNQALTDAITSIDLSVSGSGFSLQSTDCTMTLNAGSECNFTLGFTPGVAGDAVGELQVASSLVGSPERRSLFGTGLNPASPGLKVTATGNETYLAFAPQTVGTTSATTNVSITNTGSVALVVNSVALTAGANDFSAGGNCTASVAAGATCVLGVTFNPSQASTINGQLTIATNAGTQIVALSGTGVGNGMALPLALTGAVSRKAHGAAGSFDVVIDTGKTIAQAITTEPRMMGAGHVIVFTFNRPVTQPGTATVVDAASIVIGNIASVSAQGSEVTVTITGIPDKQRAAITLSNVNGVAGNHMVAIGFLVGDVTNNGAVNAGDIAATKARVNQLVSTTTLRYDLNSSGTITPQDVSMVKARAGVVLP